MGESGTEQRTLLRNTFVGRERELAELVTACESGADSDTHLFLIHGEPGIGKTRLADELASHAKARGRQVLWGRCWEGGGAPAYWPWIQVIRTHLGALDSEGRKLALESEIASDIIHEVAQIVPELRHTQSIRRPLANDNPDPNEARFRLFDAVTSFMKTGARSRPMLIVLDDLHDADEASLAMLRFVARELKGAAIMLVATYRDSEVQRSPTLSKLIGELSREARAIPMRGLSETEVERFVQAAAGRTPDDTLVSKLCAATNGNPLFLDGIVRILIAEGAMDSAGAPGRLFKIPIGVREAIRRRLSGISPEANSLLATAAAIGNDFEFNLCRSAADVSADAAHRLLDEASRAGIVTALGQGRYRFSHALIRGALYEELDTVARVRLHGKIADRIEEIYRADVDTHLAELAHHFREAGVAEKAIEYSVRAGQAAVPVGANADAVMHWEGALALMEAHGLDARPRAELLEWLGDQAHAIDQPKSVRYREAAIALYESVGNLNQAAGVRVRLGRCFAIVGQPITNGARAIEQLRRAETVLAKGPETSELAWLYEGIAAYEQQRLHLPLSADAAQRAMEISDRIGDKAVWSRAAGFYGFALALRGRLKEAFELFDRSFEAADRANLPGSGHAVSNLAAFCCAWLGDPLTARTWHELELNRPRNAHSLWDRREKTAYVARSYYEEGQIGKYRRRVGTEDRVVRFWVNGEWEVIASEMENTAEASEQADDRVSGVDQSITLGAMYNILGEHARAEVHLKYGLDNGDRGRLVIYEMRARPILALIYVGMNRLEDAAAQIARCHEIMAAGEDWRGRVGDLARAEGVVEAASGHYEVAYRHFETALAIHRKYHLALEEADTLQFWGRALAAAGDRAGAAEKFDAAVENHRTRGVGPRFLEKLTADKMRALGSNQTQIASSDARELDSTKSKSTAEFRREGEFWTIAYGGATFRLKDAKGLHYIAYLLAHPGQRIHVLDLVQAVEGSAANGRPLSQAESDPDRRGHQWPFRFREGERDRRVPTRRRVLDRHLRRRHFPAEGREGPSLCRLPARTSGAAHPRS